MKFELDAIVCLIGMPPTMGPGSTAALYGSLPPRISSPPSNAGNSDMLRSMLLNNPLNANMPAGAVTATPGSDGKQRRRSNSGNSSNASRRSSAGRGGGSRGRGRGARSASPRGRRVSSSESPLPPLSPASSSLELQVCQVLCVMIRITVIETCLKYCNHKISYLQLLYS